VTRIVLDTIVLASGFTSGAGASAWLVQRWQDGDYMLVVSEHILQEIERTLGDNRYFAARTTPNAVAANVALPSRSAHQTPERRG
jgi:predicted nucleic acid-binding protein